MVYEYDESCFIRAWRRQGISGCENIRRWRRSSFTRAQIIPLGYNFPKDKIWTFVHKSRCAPRHWAS